MLPIKSRFFHLLLFGLYQVVPPSNTHFRSHKEEAHFSKLIVISSFSCITTNFLVLNWSLKNKISVPVHWFDWNSTNYNLADNNPERSKTKHEKRKKKKEKKKKKKKRFWHVTNNYLENRFPVYETNWWMPFTSYRFSLMPRFASNWIFQKFDRCL